MQYWIIQSMGNEIQSFQGFGCALKLSMWWSCLRDISL